MDAKKNYVTYLRVSTTKQGARGLGIDAQRKMCNDFIERNGGVCNQEFLDVESGTHRDRKGLWSAIDYCKQNDCALVIAKLDRLARDVEFTFKIINTGIEIHFTDMPQVNTMILGVFASVAQYERELISSRTKAALEAKKRRGEKLGAASDKWIAAKEAKSDSIKAQERYKQGRAKSGRYMASKDVQAFFKIIRSVFPDACIDEDKRHWRWSMINAKKENRLRIIQLIRDYKELDGSGELFKSWNLQDMNDERIRMKIINQINSIKRALFNDGTIAEENVNSNVEICV